MDQGSTVEKSHGQRPIMRIIIERIDRYTVRVAAALGRTAADRRGRRSRVLPSPIVADRRVGRTVVAVVAVARMGRADRRRRRRRPGCREVGVPVLPPTSQHPTSKSI